MASPGFPLRAAADGPRRIGMPRALLHYRYGTLWTTFFEALGCDVVLSDPTDRSTVAHGDALSTFSDSPHFLSGYRELLRIY